MVDVLRHSYVFIICVPILIAIAFAPDPAVGQSKFFSTPNRPGAEGAKANAIQHTLLQENVDRRNETTTNAASITMLRDAADASITALHGAMDASFTTVGACGATGTIFGPGHALADDSHCIPALKVADDGNVLFQGGAKFGTPTLCDTTTAGTIRYNASARRMEFCNGEVWGMLGGNTGCSINFPAVSNADLNLFYDTTDAVYSGETATASVAGATAATIRRNGGNTGMSSGVTVNQGNSVGIRGRSAPLFNQTATFTLDIGSYTACWQITTKQQDASPNSFSFTGLTNQELDTLVTSNSVTVNGFDGPLTAMVSGDGGVALKVGSGPWESSAQVEPGQSVQLRMTSANAYETAHTASVSIGSYSTTWTVTTRPNCFLPNEAHSCAACTAAGGVLIATGGVPNQHVCKFSGASCPGGWSQYQNWSTTSSNTCTGSSDPSKGCYGTSCTAGGHAFVNSGVSSCTYKDGYFSGGSEGSCEQSTSVCYSSRIEIGCY